MDIIELIEKGVACWISERGRDQILSRIQSMQEVCDKAIAMKGWIIMDECKCVACELKRAVAKLEMLK